MLVTECTHCGARFRATPDQLNMRQGQVRCGQCQGIFNAFESIVRVPAATGQALPVATSVQPSPASAPPEAKAEARPAARPATLADILRPPSAEAAPAGEFRQELQDKAGNQPSEAAEPADTEAGPQEIPEHELAAAMARPAPRRLPRAWSLGVVLLTLVLAMQVAYAFRAQLARNYPALRPALEAACATAGCRVPWVNDESALRLEDSEMLEVPGKPGQIALQARIRNLSSSAQEFPHLELTLTDLTGQAAIRRVLRPADYLGRDNGTGQVMAAGSEALLSVRLETGRIRATGYELLLFYP